MKSIEDDLGGVNERSLLTYLGDIEGSKERVTPLKIGFKKGGGSVIDVSQVEIDCFKCAILVI